MRQNDKRFDVIWFNERPVIIGFDDYGVLNILHHIVQYLKENGYRGVVYFDDAVYKGLGDETFFEIEFNGEKFLTETYRLMNENDDLVKMRKAKWKSDPWYIENILNAKLD